jgi:lysophospholipase L1-like esterase
LPPYKVAVFGNSVSTVPVKEDKTVIPYPTLLQARLSQMPWEVLPRVVDGGTIFAIEAVARQTVETEVPRVVILQAGIVDCALRPLSPKERDWLSNLRPSLLRAALIRFIHHFRGEIIRMRGVIQLTPFSEYLDGFTRILEICARHNCRVGVLPIFPVTRSIARRSPLLPFEIERYNRGMQMCDSRPHYFLAGDFFGDRSIEEVLVSSESVHFNQLGHQLIADRLFTWMSPLLEEARC